MLLPRRRYLPRPTTTFCKDAYLNQGLLARFLCDTQSGIKGLKTSGCAQTVGITHPAGYIHSTASYLAVWPNREIRSPGRLVTI